MQVLKNHFNDNNTYIFGDAIQNGCQTFNIKHLPFVAKRFNVPQHMVDEVIAAHAANKAVVEEFVWPFNDEPNVVAALVANGKFIERAYQVGNEQYSQDYNTTILAALAHNGYYIEELHKHEDSIVRVAVAYSGAKHEVLHGDKSPQVRAEVARHGNYADILYKDHSYFVRESVIMSPVGEQYATLMLDDEDYDVLKAIASRGWCHDVLHKHEHREVRAEVAKAGGYLDVLVKDSHLNVLFEVASFSTQFHDILIKRDDASINVVIARADKEGKYAERFKDNQHWAVREAVAENGFFCEELKDDSDIDVRKAATKWLDENAGK